MSAKSEIEHMAAYILNNIPGEPSQSEGAGHTAVRLLRMYRRALKACADIAHDTLTIDSNLTLGVVDVLKLIVVEAESATNGKVEDGVAHPAGHVYAVEETD